MVSCFKLIVCAGDQNQKHDYHQERLAAAVAGYEESTTLPDKRRWSFRRKSSSQRVIIHTLGTNTPSGNTGGMDFVTAYLPPTLPTAPENSSPVHSNNEETNLSMNVYPTGPSDDRIGIIADVEESTVTLIQTAVRRFWAQRELAKLKMLVKLQAAVRGHLVRRNAVGSLHCIQAIVKMQALAHAQYGQADADSSSTSTIILDKLLSNSFARKLLKSAPNPKPLNIKWDPSSPCPAWSWMERWMSLAPPTMYGSVMEIEHKQNTNEKGKRSHEEDTRVSKNSETFSSKITTDGSKFFGGSECGTELSITSALNSPNDPYRELPNPRTLVGEIPDEATYNVIKDGDIRSNVTSTFCLNQEKHDSSVKNSEDAKKDDKLVKKELQGTKSDARLESKTKKNLQPSRSSVKDSPRNLVTSPGSQGTPSSQLVTKSGSTKNSESWKSKDSLASVKKSYSSSARDSSASDNEQPQQKVDRRRSSLGPDTYDLYKLKATDSNGSVSLPSYMKATVSAKARLFASNSPRLSSDVLEKDISLTKRLSLPVANVNQISPKLLQPSNGNGTH